MANNIQQTKNNNQIYKPINQILINQKPML